MAPRSRCLVRIAAAALLVAAAPAHAEPAAKAPTADKKKAAKAYVDAGLAAEEQGDYDGAIALYRKAHELIPHPVMLFNMAQAHRLAGHRAEALDLYRQYVAAVPRGDLAAEARRWVASLDAALAQEAAEAAAKADADRLAKEQAAEEARRATPPPEPTPAPAPPAPVDLARSEAAPDDPGRTWRIAGLSAAGVGVGALIGGGLFGLRAKGLSDDLSERGATFDPQKEEDGESAERTMFILCGVGGALVAGGLTVYALNRPDDESPTISAVVTPTHVGMVVGSSF